jgi:hypothetical protein
MTQLNKTAPSADELPFRNTKQEFHVKEEFSKEFQRAEFYCSGGVPFGSPH